jgi:putative ABC transport system substrate-binding protein
VLATSGVSILPLQRASRDIPLVFAQTIDPVGLGIVESLHIRAGTPPDLPRLSSEPKWLEFLKEMAPSTTRVAVLRDPFDPAGIGQWAAMQSVAPALALELRVVNIRDVDALESGVNKAAGLANTGLLITSSAPGSVHRDLIIRLAAQHRLPAIYPYAFYVKAGGLFSYGPDTLDQYRRVAGYVDRIFKGERPADLPVQAPTKCELALNRNTARAIGINVPAALLAAADEVIE